MARKIFKVSLTNVNSVGTRCGYGEGYTHQEAIDDALRRARETDPDAYYSKQTDSVCFWAPVFC